MNQEQEIRAMALNAAIALIAALPANEAVSLLRQNEELAADQTIRVIAECFAKYINGKP